MLKRKQVRLMQLNNNYGNQYYIPYSVGVLTSYAKQFDEIVDNFQFLPFIYKRERVEEIVAKIGQVDVLGVSVYVWNWSLSVEVVRRVKELYPKTLIIFGGPHIPDDCSSFFTENPFVEIAVHGEGEAIFSEILRAFIKGEGYAEIPAISFFHRNVGKVIHNPSPPRMKNLLDLPSPYLKGEFDSLIGDNADVEWMALWETNRGCPFQCAYCDWGGAVGSKVIEFEWNRLVQEIQWFSKNKVGFVFGCDANFGIRKRDIEIARALVAAKNQFGYPSSFRVSFTKNSTDRIFEVAKVLHDGGMLKGVSLSMQSLNESTLEAVKRSNIKLETFQQLQSKYNEAGISTFTELILGLPGESYETFANGINTLLERGQHSQIVIYNCTVMPNAEMGSAEYQEKYQIKTVTIPIFTAHSMHNENDPTIEYEPIIVQTYTMNLSDWRKMHHFAWVVQCFHMLGLLQCVAIFLRYWTQISYREFYEELVIYGYDNPEGLIGKELTTLDGVLDGVLAGRGFDQYLPDFSDVSWPPEEASLLRYSNVKDELYFELKLFIKNFLKAKGLNIDKTLLDDLILYQQTIIVSPNDKKNIEISLQTNMPDYVVAFRNGSSAELVQRPITYKVVSRNEWCGDKKLYARDIVWYGRKGGRFLYQLTNSESNPGKMSLP